MSHSKQHTRSLCAITSILLLGACANDFAEESPIVADAWPSDDDDDPPDRGRGSRASVGTVPRLDFAVTSDLDIALTGDVDGDGNAETILWRTEDGRWFGRESDGTRTWAQGSEPVLGLPDDKPLVGDLDGDGDDEIVVWRVGTRRWYAKRHNNSLFWAAGSEPVWGLPGDEPHLGDLDGDGDDELILWRHETGQWFARDAETGQRTWPQGSEPVWSFTGDRRLIGDLNGDGADERVAWRPSEGQWYAVETDGTPIWGSAPVWGTNGDVPLLGNLDNAGGDEIVIWRPSTGRWYAKRAISLQRIWDVGDEPTFGAAGDHPFVAPISAGAADLVIHRPDTTRWWAQTTGGAVLINNVSWGHSGAPARIVNIESDDDFADAYTPGGNVFFTRLAASHPGDPERWWLRIDVLIENTGTAPIQVTGFTVDTNQSSPVNQNLDTPVTIAGRASRTIVVPSGFDGTGTFPTSVVVEAHIEGFDDPISRTANLVEYESGTASGGVDFPGTYVDLITMSNDPLVWRAGTHSHTLTQRYAYDYSIRRWDSGTDEWSPYWVVGNGNSYVNSVAFGHFLWAPASGTVVRCKRSEVDPGWGVEGEDGGGNTVIIELADGTYLALHHLQEDSVPVSLCPIEGPVGDDWTPLSIPIQQGAFVGQLGDTGQSSGPHLHIHITDGPNPHDPDTRGLPLRFRGISVTPSYNADTTTPTWNTIGLNESAAAFNLHLLP